MAGLKIWGLMGADGRSTPLGDDSVCVCYVRRVDKMVEVAVPAQYLPGRMRLEREGLMIKMCTTPPSHCIHSAPQLVS